MIFAILSSTTFFLRSARNISVGVYTGEICEDLEYVNISRLVIGKLLYLLVLHLGLFESFEAMLGFLDIWNLFKDSIGEYSNFSIPRKILLEPDIKNRLLSILNANSRYTHVYLLGASERISRILKILAKVFLFSAKHSRTRSLFLKTRPV